MPGINVHYLGKDGYIPWECLGHVCQNNESGVAVLTLLLLGHCLHVSKG